MRMKYFVLDSLKLKAEQISDNEYLIRLSNGEQIKVIEQPVYNGETWEWKVDTQYFSKEEYALRYLKRLISEKLTGIRVLYHEKREAPDICGNGRACRHPGKCNTALCSDCPVAEAFFAECDGVKLIYAV